MNLPKYTLEIDGIPSCESQELGDSDFCIDNGESAHAFTELTIVLKRKRKVDSLKKAMLSGEKIVGRAFKDGKWYEACTINRIEGNVVVFHSPTIYLDDF